MSIIRHADWLFIYVCEGYCNLVIHLSIILDSKTLFIGIHIINFEIKINIAIKS